MDFLEAIHEQTQRNIQELGWSEDEVNAVIAQANEGMASFAKRANTEQGDAPENSSTCHSCTYDGGFIVFGGWTNIYDSSIPKGVKGHHMYLAFGGLGAGGWKGSCDLYPNEISFDAFYEKVVSFMYMYLPVFEQKYPIFVFFDKKSKRLGCAVPECSLSIGMGGGTVDVRSK